MPRRVVATAVGGPEVLEVVEHDPGRPGAGQVRIAVRAAGINPVDWKRYGGAMGTPELPMPVGFEAAGVVVEAAQDAEGPAGPVRQGDEVIAFRIAGAYAEEVVVDAAACVPKPAALGWEPAGGLMLAGATAVHALAVVGLGEGELVLVHGGAGGVGQATIQLARARGARVVATASERNHERLRALGAEPTTYGDGLADRVRALAPEGVDAAVDCVGTDEAIDVSVELVGDPDRVVTIAGHEHGAEVGIRRIGGGPGADPGTELRDRARLELTAAVERGELEVEARGLPLDEVVAAHREGQGGHVVGKLVLVP